MTRRAATRATPARPLHVRLPPNLSPAVRVVTFCSAAPSSPTVVAATATATAVTTPTPVSAMQRLSSRRESLTAHREAPRAARPLLLSHGEGVSVHHTHCLQVARREAGCARVRLIRYRSTLRRRWAALWRSRCRLRSAARRRCSPRWSAVGRRGAFASLTRVRACVAAHHCGPRAVQREQLRSVCGQRVRWPALSKRARRAHVTTERSGLSALHCALLRAAGQLALEHFDVLVRGFARRARARAKSVPTATD